MEQSPSTPTKLHSFKKSHTVSLSTLPRQKQHHLPSRYAQQKSSNKNSFQEVLNSIESNMKLTNIERLSPSNNKDSWGNGQKGLGLISPNRSQSKKRIVKLESIKVVECRGSSSDLGMETKPLNRVESDLKDFKKIFIEPRQKVLKKIQTKQNIDINSKLLSKEYQKILQFENGGSSLLSSLKKRADGSLQDYEDKLRSPEKVEEIKDSEMNDYFKEAIQLLDNNEKMESTRSQLGQDFYEEQIRIQPPQLPNSSIASTLAPGCGYAPSIPLNASLISKSHSLSSNSNLRQLLMRLKASSTTEDIQRQAHLSYFLGVIYEQQRKYISALKFYRRYLSFAKAMQDKIGMTLGTNRVAVSSYYCGDVTKSVNYHNQNLRLSDGENCFAGFYNLGICYRRLGKLEEAVEHFDTAVGWAGQRGELDSECIGLGQLAMTYLKMELYQQSLNHFQRSLDLCHKLKKSKLQLFNLRNIVRIASQYDLKSSRNLLQIGKQAYECAKLLEDKKMIQIFGCNVGIIKGLDRFRKIRDIQLQDMIEDVQEIDYS